MRVDENCSRKAREARLWAVSGSSDAVAEYLLAEAILALSEVVKVDCSYYWLFQVYYSSQNSA